jgi:hypothetical protein
VWTLFSGKFSTAGCRERPVRGRDELAMPVARCGAWTAYYYFSTGTGTGGEKKERRQKEVLSTPRAAEHFSLKNGRRLFQR